MTADFDAARIKSMLDAAIQATVEATECMLDAIPVEMATLTIDTIEDLKKLSHWQGAGIFCSMGLGPHGALILSLEQGSGYRLACGLGSAHGGKHNVLDASAQHAPGHEALIEPALKELLNVVGCAFAAKIAEHLHAAVVPLPPSASFGDRAKIFAMLATESEHAQLLDEAALGAALRFCVPSLNVEGIWLWLMPSFVVNFDMPSI